MAIECDADSLASAAACFNGVSERMLQQISAYLLCQIANSGGGGDSCLLCDDVDPVDAPTCECGLFYNRSAGSLWYWDSNSSQWVALIAGA